MKKYFIKGPNEEIYEYVTKNGLSVFIWPSKLNEEVALSLTVKYGSIHTSFKTDKKYSVPSGTAHFLEHVKFNEEDKKTAHDFFYSHGSYVNAYTTYNHTSYEVTCNKDIVDNLKHLLYFVYNGYFTESLVEKEKPIIIEESKMTQDNPYNQGYQALSNNLYINSNRRFLITGEEKDIKKISKEDMENVFNNYYHPKNMFLTVCGNVNKEEIINTVDEFILSHQFNEYSNPEWIREKEPLKVKKVNDQINVNVAMPKLMLSIKYNKDIFKDIGDLKTNYLINLLLDMNFGSTSEFNEYLYNNDLKDEFFYYVSSEEDNIIINFEVSTNYPSKVVDLILKKYNNLTINEEDYKRKIKLFIASTILGFEDVNEVNSLIRNNIIKYGRIIDNNYNVVKSITLEDIKTFKKLIKNNVYSSMILMPKLTE